MASPLATSGETLMTGYEMLNDKTAGEVISLMGDSLLPYATADEIIEEVKKGAPDTRERVMQILVAYLTESLGRRDESMAHLKKAILQKETTNPG